MAWFARIDAPAVFGQDTVTVPVNYYDDAVLDGDGLPSLVFTAAPVFPVVGTTLTDVQKTVISNGQRARAAQQRAALLNASAPVGTVIPIP